jgi:hypothetical protein
MSFDHVLGSRQYFSYERSLRNCLLDTQPNAPNDLLDVTVKAFMAEAREDFLECLDRALRGEERHRIAPDPVENGPDRPGNENNGRDEELSMRTEVAVRVILLQVSSRYKRCVKDVLEDQRRPTPPSRRRRRNYSPPSRRRRLDYSPRPRRRRQNNSPGANPSRLRLAPLRLTPESDRASIGGSHGRRRQRHDLAHQSRNTARQTRINFILNRDSNSEQE